jgi:glycosyltransferase involved in cell wall biosynthesis
MRRALRLTVRLTKRALRLTVRLTKLSFYRRRDLIRILSLYGLRGAAQRALDISRRKMSTEHKSVFSSSMANHELNYYLPEILIISGDEFGTSHEYRVQNFCSSFAENGKLVVWCSVGDAKAIQCLPASIRIVIFWRTDSPSKDFVWIPAAKDNGCKFGYDTDDLTFDKRYYNPNNVPGLLRASPQVRDYLMNESLNNQESFIRDTCDFAIAATPQLESSFINLGIEKIYRLPIVLPRWMEKQALINKNTANSSMIVIGYASGTHSHDKDFEVAKSAIIQIMRKYENVVLSLLGAIPQSANSFPPEISNRILTSGLVEHDRLLEKISSYDINIAPLELNEFTEAKSATKFMHAASMGIPTVASPTAPFRELIQHAKNGFLAEGESDWYESLERLILDQSLRVNMGIAAKSTFQAKCRVDSWNSELSLLLDWVESTSESDINQKKLNTQKRILLILPPLILDGGGHRVATLISLYAASLLDVELHVFFLNDSRDSNFHKNWLSQFSFHTLIVTKDPRAYAYDLYISTHYSTINFVKSLTNYRRHINIIQDFEVIFNSMSYEALKPWPHYIDPKLTKVVLGRWASMRILNSGGNYSNSLSLPIDTKLYKYIDRSQRISRKRVIFYFHDSSERRMPQLIQESIRILKNLDSSLEISVFGSGSEKIDFYGVGPGLGSISRGELAQIYEMSDLGVAFSPTNESLIPLEMMATGLPVVGILAPDYPEISVTSFATVPNPISIASACIKVLGQEEVYLNEINKLDTLSENLESENEVGEQFAKILAKFISKEFTN